LAAHVGNKNVKKAPNKNVKNHGQGTSRAAEESSVFFDGGYVVGAILSQL
jgi:hypothetical protein